MLFLMLHMLVFVLGFLHVAATLISAIRTFVLPRSAPVKLIRFVLLSLRFPSPTDPISISREEFDTACDELANAGVPLKLDRDQAWRDFAGWRVNYDAVLLALATLTMAPEAPWSSDRATKQHLLPFLNKRR